MNHKGELLMVEIFAGITIIAGILTGVFYYDARKNEPDKQAQTKESLEKMDLTLEKVVKHQESLSEAMNKISGGYKAIDSTVEELKKTQISLLSDHYDIHSRLKTIRDEQTDLRILLTKKQTQASIPLPITIMNESIKVVPIKPQVNSVRKESETSK